MIVCVCNNVSDRAIRAAQEGGVCTMRGLRNELGVAGCCGKCAPVAKQMLKQPPSESPLGLVDTVNAVAQDAGIRLRSALYQPTA